MNKTTLTILCGLPLALAACGGGNEDGPTVTNVQTDLARYSQPLTVSVSGFRLDQGLEMVVDGPCENPVPFGTATSTFAQFRCTVTGQAQITPRIRSVTMQREMASVRVDAAGEPQVSMTVSDGTRSGTFTIDLDLQRAKLTVDNFLHYVNTGFYTQTVFHRVVRGFVVQAGGFTAADVQLTPTRPPIRNEAGNGLSNLRGTIAMARTSDPDSATSQFFVNLVDNPSLNPGGVTAEGYAVFGRVSAGLDVIDEIGRVPTRPASPSLPNLPVTPIRIILARQIR